MFNLSKLLISINAKTIEADKDNFKLNINMWFNPAYIFKNKYLEQQGIGIIDKTKLYLIRTVIFGLVTFILLKLSGS